MIVTPYGDPNAHGTLGKTLTFIRRRGGVYVRPYRIPKDPRSVDQLAQRQLFQDAIDAWFASSSQTKDFYNNRASGQLYTGYNLFLQTYMLGNLPSTTQFQLIDIESATLGNVRSTFIHGWRFSFNPDPAGAPWGSIWDNENLFSDGSTHTPARTLTLVLTSADETLAVEFRDTVTIDFDGAQQLTIFLPAVGSNTTLYVSDDGSSYWDSGFTQLACASGV